MLARELNGSQLCKLPQTEFISRCLQTHSIEEQQARFFYQKLWRTRIDSRQKHTAPSSAIEGISISQEVEAIKTPFKERIRPGMFVRISPEASKLSGVDILMIMSPLQAKDFDGQGEERQFVCAVVGPSIMADAYELHLSKLDTYSVKDMTAEILMEYDMATRYYYIDL